MQVAATLTGHFFGEINTMFVTYTKKMTQVAILIRIVFCHLKQFNLSSDEWKNISNFIYTYIYTYI